ncbi:unnamed protein product [Echinostoma caproni]|uniref:CST complex subunit CTC1 n=1 Tax=Echinostoma caproni TaxID=27848 RepID=A0A183A282_9TREM|nr:unnamed protein product [Echinostoma caproni]
MCLFVLVTDHVTDLDLISGPASPEDAASSRNSFSDMSNTNGNTASSSGDTGPAGSFAVFPCGLQPGSDSQEWPVGVWRHLAVVFSRAGMIKSSSCSVYLDGRLVGVQRVSFFGCPVQASMIYQWLVFC